MKISVLVLGVQRDVPNEAISEITLVWGLQEFSHPSLLSQVISRELDQKKSSWGTKQINTGCQHPS